MNARTLTLSYHEAMNDGLAAIAEAFQRTTPAFFLRFSMVSLFAYFVGYAINWAAAPIPDHFATFVGAGLILATFGITLSLHGAMATDRASELTPGVPAVMDAFAGGMRTLAYLTLATTLVLLAGAVFGLVGTILTFILIAWTAPLTLYLLVDTDANLFGSLANGVRHTIAAAPNTLILLVFNAACLTIGVFTLLGWVYLVPLAAVANAVTYRELHGIRNA